MGMRNSSIKISPVVIDGILELIDNGCVYLLLQINDKYTLLCDGQNEFLLFN
jgi:hypothetical protein